MSTQLNSDARPALTRLSDRMTLRCRLRWSRFHVAVALFCALLIGAVWILTIQRINYERNDAVADAMMKSSSLAFAFEEHTLRTLSAVNQVLNFIDYRLTHNGATLDAGKLMRENKLDPELLADLAIVDESGNSVFRSKGAPPINIADREHFTALRKSTIQDTFVGRAERDSESGAWTIPVARRLVKPDGSFGGVVVAALDAEYLTRFYQSIDLGKEGVVSLVGLDGYSRARNAGGKASFGEYMRGSTLWAAQFKVATGTFTGEGKLDGVPRFYSFRTLRPYALIAMVGVSKAEVLAPFHLRERNYLLLAALLSAFILVFAISSMAAISWHARSLYLLGQTESRYREIFENTKDCIFIIDVHEERQFRFAALNPAEEEATGLSSAQTTGRFVEEVLAAPMLEEVVTNYRRCLEEGGPVSYGEQLILPAGERHFWTTLTPIRNDRGSIGRIVGVAHDITERKRAEDAVTQLNDTLEVRVTERTAELAIANSQLANAKERAEQASRAKSAFLATVSHELRTPMNGILGTLELLAQSDLGKSDAELLQAARNSGKSLLSLLNDLLDMAKIEAGRIEIVPAPYSLHALIDRTMSTHRVNAENKGLTISSSLDPRIPEWVLIDDLRVGQILGNLVGNAIKFTAAGSVSLDLFLVEQRNDTYLLKFCVQDSGPGIDAATLQQLFMPFEQGTAKAARAEGGTGLGLAVCRGLAERMDGKVFIESVQGVGTTAILELGLQSAPHHAVQKHIAAETVRQLADVHSRQTVGGGKLGAQTARILIVDDHPINRMVLSRQLVLLGYVVEECEDGKAALDRFRARKPDLVLTDCEMPEMDGFELARAIRECEGGSSRTPVIACTAHAMAEFSARCIAAGMDAVLHKPIALADLTRVLMTHLPSDVNTLAAAVRHCSGQAPAAATPFDATQLALLAGGNETTRRNLLGEFRLACVHDSAKLRQAVSESNGSDVARLAHRIRGASMLVGAAGLASACEELELAGRTDDWECIEARLAKIFWQELKGVIEYVDAA